MLRLLLIGSMVLVMKVVLGEVRNVMVLVIFLGEVKWLSGICFAKRARRSLDSIVVMLVSMGLGVMMLMVMLWLLSFWVSDRVRFMSLVLEVV